MASSGRCGRLSRLALRAPVLRLMIAGLAAFGAAACSSADLSVTAPTSAKCQVTVDNSPSSVPATGGTGTLTVTTTRDCTWDAASAAAWVTLTGETTGQGSGAVSYRVGANVDPSTRRGTLTVNDAQVVVAQDAAQCRFTVSPTSASPGSGGARLTVNVETASAACAWTAASDSSWIHVNPASASGTGNTTLTIDANTGGARTGTAVVAGQAVRIEQAAVPPSPAPTPTPAPTPAPTPSPEPTPTPTPTPGPSPPPPSPTPCTFTVAPLQVSIAALGGAGAITVTAAATCAWTAASDSPWLTIASVTTGIGNGVVAYAVAATSATTARTATLTVAGQRVVFTQAAATPPPCTYAIAPTSATVGPAATTLTIAVTTQAGCKWTEQQNDPWLQEGNTSSGTGSGSATVDVERYKGNAQRTGTITIAGQTLTVTQTK